MSSEANGGSREHLDRVRESVKLACHWLADVAQVKSDADLTPEQRRHHHASYVGAMRGEYNAAKRRWGFFCPVWHTGQAVKALTMAAPFVGDWTLAPARAGADFILANQIKDGPDAGHIMAFEDKPDKTNSSAILECLEGLFTFADASGESRYADAAIAALRWLRDRAFMPDEGLFRDEYDPQARVWSEKAYGVFGRPLLDDAAFVTGYRRTGDKSLLDVAVRTADRLLKDESPPGNWMAYPPCSLKEQRIHPRHAYWWGMPMLAVYDATGDSRYLDAFQRSVAWYQKALRRDGTFIRGTFADCSSDGLGHAMSGAACAAIMFQAFHRKTGDAGILPSLELALKGCMDMQFTRAADPNLQGAVLEKILPHGGSDASPYHLRDLGTIFHVQAACMYLRDRK